MVRPSQGCTGRRGRGPSARTARTSQPAQMLSWVEGARGSDWVNFLWTPVERYRRRYFWEGTWMRHILDPRYERVIAAVLSFERHD